jgi:hypothetical protein
MKKGQSKKICHCGKRSIPGLISGVALCQYHYDCLMFGKEWADKCLAQELQEKQAKEK